MISPPFPWSRRGWPRQKNIHGGTTARDVNERRIRAKQRANARRTPAFMTRARRVTCARKGRRGTHAVIPRGRLMFTAEL